MTAVNAQQVMQTQEFRLIGLSREHGQDWARVMLNGRQQLTIRQQQMFTHLVLKSLGSAGKSGREMFGWCTSGDLEQDCAELAQILFKERV